MSDEIPIYPMAEALRFWRKKVPMKAKDYRDLAEEYRVYAFTVAKLAQIDQVAAVQKSLERALSTGKSMKAWRDDIEDVFVRAGWKGDTRYRLDTIFRTNIQTAYNAGKWAQAQADIDIHPYGMYDAVNDSRTRPDHLAQDGKIYRLDHPFWRTWTPPNGYRCRCTFRTLSQEDVDAMGGAKKDLPDDSPDEGFKTNPGHTPGEARLLSNLDLKKRLSEYSPAFRQHFLQAASTMPFQLMSRHLDDLDVKSMQTLLWAQKQGGVDGYEDWIDALYKDRRKDGGIASRGRVYPVGNIPASIASRLKSEPRMSLVVMTDKTVGHLVRDAKKSRGATLTRDEIKAIPKRFRDRATEWYEDTEKPGTFLALERMGKGKWLKVVFRVNGRIKKVVAHVVQTAGVVGRRNLDEDRYKKITH